MSKKKIKSYQTNDSKTKYNFRRTGVYIRKGILGEGTFGKVILVEREYHRDKDGSKRFAIKISKRFKRLSNADSASLMNENKKPKELNFIEIRELVIMRKIRHKNVVNLLDFNFCREDREIWILMDYLSSDLGKFFSANKDNPSIMNERFLKNISHQILEGVNYLHENSIIHRDLKLENILYDEQNNVAKIGDFGLSRQYDYDISTQYTDVGTYPYKPPELLLGLTHYSTEFDIWSLGCIFVEICTGAPLFPENDSLGVLKIMFKIFGSFNDDLLPGFQNFPMSHLIKSLPPTKSIGLVNYIKEHKKFEFENDYFFDLIEKMLQIDPTKRISAKDCLEHPWFKSSKN